MSLQDLKLQLPESTSLSRLLICPDFEQYNELLQRVVVYLLLHTHPDSAMSDIALYDVSSKATTGYVDSLNRSLSSLSKAATKELNADTDPSDTENTIQELDITLSEVDRRFFVTVNITTASDKNITGELSING